MRYVVFNLIHVVFTEGCCANRVQGPPEIPPAPLPALGNRRKAICGRTTYERN